MQSNDRKKIDLTKFVNKLECRVDVSQLGNSRAKRKTKNIRMDEEPLIYQGKRLTTFADLVPLIKLDSFETVVYERLKKLKTNQFDFIVFD
jgi:hypothetical protein